MNNKLRMTAAGIATAVALGVAAPAAQARSTQAPARAAAVQTVQVGSQSLTAHQLTTLAGLSTQAQTTGQVTAADVAALKQAGLRGGKLSAILAVIKKVPGAFKWLSSAAKSSYKAAKGNLSKAAKILRTKILQLSSWNPVRWILSKIDHNTLTRIIDFFS
ncbi:hypothetical protein OG897_25010 [Streptomyces sp. NBC_00237]|uniref:hypothetical protein n=1 Tax=Streptomyces sp. NBC_00237 TaxID=2975687 RepID=UPI00225C1C8B|nr:hypothetical protein [Streptomyces sp. NBC_00237]MCX5204702.1 hypothetical protein [Streptomyces sp. NBC_00237]